MSCINCQIKVISKLLSYALRHNPSSIGINLDGNGWVLVDELIEKIKNSGKHNLGCFSIDILNQIVATNDKKRFEYNEDKTKIRACQGHSVDINLDLKPTEPPDILYHGTNWNCIAAIRMDGLKKMNRQYVHLSKNTETASQVGQRKGSPIILKINSKQMFKDGYEFFLSHNGVWLTNNVPYLYITIMFAH